MKKFVLGLILSLVLILFAFNISYAGSIDVKEFNCYLQNVPKDSIIQDLKNYVVLNSYSYSHLDKENNLYKIKTGCNLSACYFKVQITEYKNEIKVTASASSTVDSLFTGAKGAKNFIKLLKEKYPQNLINNYRSQEERQVIVSQKKEEALKNRILKIDTKIYSKIDPEFAENKELIKKGIHDKDNKRIDYYTNTPAFYSVTKDNLTLNYDKEGYLKRIKIINESHFPRIVYNYNYPDGDLKGFSIELSYLNQECFDTNGEVNNWQGFNEYMKRLQKKDKKQMGTEEESWNS